MLQAINQAGRVSYVTEAWTLAAMVIIQVFYAGVGRRTADRGAALHRLPCG